MANLVYDDVKVIDCDTHVVEPPDLWSSRISSERWGDLVPHLKVDPDSGEEVWYSGDRAISAPGITAIAFSTEFPPMRPKRMSEFDPSTWEATARVAKMDEFGIYSQVLYPNVAGFGAGRFSEMSDPELALLSLKAYNDFLVDYSNEAPGRFVPVMAVPFWDVELSVAEIQRSFENGHKGIVFTGEPESWGQPPLTARHWDPIWKICEDLGIPVNFHIASGQIPVAPGGGAPEHGVRAAFASGGTNFFMANAAVFGKVIFSGVCHRFPRLNFVSVESGIGWIPFALESMDWQWLNCAVTMEHPEYDLLPSEYFRRQIYGCFWFERDAARAAIEILGPDNFLYSTDFPHPGNMAAGPATVAQNPRDYVASELTGIPDEAMRKLLHDNAARLYHLA